MELARIAIAALLLGAVSQDDGIAAKVRALAEKAASDDLTDSDEALAELVALGPPALDAIRARQATASIDLKARLQKAAAQIERVERWRKVSSSPPPITLRADARPVASVLDELKKASGQPVVFRQLPDKKVSVDLKGAPFWEAIDAVCKAHGGIIWRVNGPEILVETGAYRDRPRVSSGNVLLFLDRFVWDTYAAGAERPRFVVTGGVAWTGASPALVLPTIDAVTTDEGTELGFRGTSAQLYDVEPADPAARSYRLEHRCAKVPTETASTLTVRGTLRIKHVFEMKRILTTPAVAGPRKDKQPAGKYNVAITRTETTEAMYYVNIALDWKGRADEFALESAQWRIVDDQGKTTIPFAAVMGFAGGAETNWLQISLAASLPKKAAAATVELWVPADAEERVVPFEFKGLKLR